MQRSFGIGLEEGRNITKGSRKFLFLLARPIRGGGVKAGTLKKTFLKLEKKTFFAASLKGTFQPNIKIKETSP